jgi:hypothetical protein
MCQAVGEPGSSQYARVVAHFGWNNFTVNVQERQKVFVFLGHSAANDNQVW